MRNSDNSAFREKIRSESLLYQLVRDMIDGTKRNESSLHNGVVRKLHLVASSKTNTLLSVNSALARLTSCLCPCERFEPPSSSLASSLPSMVLT